MDEMVEKRLKASQKSNLRYAKTALYSKTIRDIIKTNFANDQRQIGTRNFMKKLKNKSVIAIVCLLIVGMLLPLPVRAESSALKMVTLNPASLRPAGNVWNQSTGKLLYFGKEAGSFADGLIEKNYRTLAYRVLASSPETQLTSNTDCLLLDCNTGLRATEMAFQDVFHEFSTPAANLWSNSDLREWLNGNEFYLNQGSGDVPATFSDIERSAIVQTRLKSADAYGNGENKPFSCMDYESLDHVFLLSAKEVQNLYANQRARVKRLFFESSSDNVGPGWWLRTATNATFGDGSAAMIEFQYGEIYTATVTYKEGKNLSPAFNVDMDSIAFASAVEFQKPSTDLVPVELAITKNGSELREWKATLIDSGKTIEVPQKLQVTQEKVDGVTTVKVPYRYEGDDVTQISVMITDKAYTEDDAQVLYYGALQGTDLETAKVKSGIGTFTLPNELPKDAKVYILAEDINGAKETDYASVPCEIAVTIAEPDEEPSTNPEEPSVNPEDPSDNATDPSDSATDAPENPADTETTNNNNAAQTSDSTSILWLLIPAFISGIIAIIAVAGRKRRI